MSAQPEPRWKVAAVVAFYMVAALVMVFANKAVLTSTPTLPHSFLFIQLLVAVFLLHLTAFFRPSALTIPSFEFSRFKKLFPIIAVNVTGLVFNTLCLRDVEASFFQIARGLVLPLTIIVTSIFTFTAPSLFVVVSSSIVTFGYVIGVSPSSATSLKPSQIPTVLALFYGLLSSLMIAFHAVLIKPALTHVNNSSIQLAYWTNLGSAIFLTPVLFFSGEIWELRDMITGGVWGSAEQNFVIGSLVTGTFGFFVCLASLMSVKVTSPVTHMFSSAARSVLQTILGVLLFNDLLTVHRASSIGIILLGTMYYTWIKSRPATLSPPPPSSRADGDVEKGLMLDLNEKNGVRRHSGDLVFSSESDEER